MTTVPRAVVVDEDDEGETALVIAEREWRIQCKRYKEIGPTLMRAIVEELIPDPDSAPYGAVVAAACNVSAQTIAAFHEEAANRGAEEHHLWMKANLEDELFRPENDHLLFAYFNLSLGTQRRSNVQAARNNLAIKRKLLRTFGVEGIQHPLMANVLIRDIDEDRYPYRTDISDFGDQLFPPWHRAIARRFVSQGVLITGFQFNGWVRPDGSWDYLPDSDNTRREAKAPGLSWDEYKTLVPDDERAIISQNWILPYDSIVEVDPIGDLLPEEDNWKILPQLLCRFNSAEAGPYAVFAADSTLATLWYAYPLKGMRDEELAPEKHTKLFP